ncbi:uncharacterized protein CLUP02_17972 [Colletotrichum lupini]|uniref:Uncharacterized protein n=1 Tax=Colletotrichum lupini TaxID=145971 RepID=A0A9Q8SFL0_9PEZI|nr:uncharacterized protein CLUP02_17972 [Colletotrichum lupini]UQC76459.1 hypothetical protein CLUP02_17972 [Colletotrichum lupini]
MDWRVRCGVTDEENAQEHGREQLMIGKNQATPEMRQELAQPMDDGQELRLEQRHEMRFPFLFPSVQEAPLNNQLPHTPGRLTSILGAEVLHLKMMKKDPAPRRRDVPAVAPCLLHGAAACIGRTCLPFLGVLTTITTAITALFAAFIVTSYHVLSVPFKAQGHSNMVLALQWLARASHPMPHVEHEPREEIDPLSGLSNEVRNNDGCCSLAGMTGVPWLRTSRHPMRTVVSLFLTTLQTTNRPRFFWTIGGLSMIPSRHLISLTRVILKHFTISKSGETPPTAPTAIFISDGNLAGVPSSSETYLLYVIRSVNPKCTYPYMTSWQAGHHALCSPFWVLVFWEQVYVRIFLFRWDNLHHIPPSPNFVADSDRDMAPISVAHWIKCGLVSPSSPVRNLFREHKRETGLGALGVILEQALQSHDGLLLSRLNLRKPHHETVCFRHPHTITEEMQTTLARVGHPVDQQSKKALTPSVSLCPFKPPAVACGSLQCQLSIAQYVSEKEQTPLMCRSPPPRSVVADRRPDPEPRYSQSRFSWCHIQAFTTTQAPEPGSFFPQSLLKRGNLVARRPLSNAEIAICRASRAILVGDGKLNLHSGTWTIVVGEPGWAVPASQPTHNPLQAVRRTYLGSPQPTYYPAGHYSSFMRFLSIHLGYLSTPRSFDVAPDYFVLALLSVLLALRKTETDILHGEYVCERTLWAAPFRGSLEGLVRPSDNLGYPVVPRRFNFPSSKSRLGYVRPNLKINEYSLANAQDHAPPLLKQHASCKKHLHTGVSINLYGLADSGIAYFVCRRSPMLSLPQLDLVPTRCLSAVKEYLARTLFVLGMGPVTYNDQSRAYRYPRFFRRTSTRRPDLPSRNYASNTTRDIYRFTKNPALKSSYNWAHYHQMTGWSSEDNAFCERLPETPVSKTTFEDGMSHRPVVRDVTPFHSFFRYPN